MTNIKRIFFLFVTRKKYYIVLINLQLFAYFLSALHYSKYTNKNNNNVGVVLWKYVVNGFEIYVFCGGERGVVW